MLASLENKSQLMNDQMQFKGHCKWFQATLDKKVSNILREILEFNDSILNRVFTALKSFIYFLMEIKNKCIPNEDFMSNFNKKVTIFLQQYESRTKINWREVCYTMYLIMPGKDLKVQLCLQIITDSDALFFNQLHQMLNDFLNICSRKNNDSFLPFFERIYFMTRLLCSIDLQPGGNWLTYQSMIDAYFQEVANHYKLNLQKITTLNFISLYTCQRCTATNNKFKNSICSNCGQYPFFYKRIKQKHHIEENILQTQHAVKDENYFLLRDDLIQKQQQEMHQLYNCSTVTGIIRSVDVSNVSGWINIIDCEEKQDICHFNQNSFVFGKRKSFI